jgi:hypothetical protein
MDASAPFGTSASSIFHVSVQPQSKGKLLADAHANPTGNTAQGKWRTAKY